MRKLNFLLAVGLLVVAFAPFFWEEFPSMAVLYALMTGMSVLYGLGCLLGPKETSLWQQRNVPADVQRLWSQRMGALYLVNAALCPPGLGCWRRLSPMTRTSFCSRRSSGSFWCLCWDFVPIFRLQPKKH